MVVSHCKELLPLNEFWEYGDSTMITMGYLIPVRYSGKVHVILQ